MALQNRVDPSGRLHAVDDRGTLMGNRGCLHDSDRQIAPRPIWTTPAWITCRLDFNGRRRPLMQPRAYTELFFLDEATALAAGHRPCGECRRAEYLRFKDSFFRGNVDRCGEARFASTIDRLMAQDRRAAAGGSPLELQPEMLPDGALFRYQGSPWLKLGAFGLEWSFAGYRSEIQLPREIVAVITPLATLNALSAGYVCGVHPSATPR